jgi:hypothetical protein
MDGLSRSTLHQFGVAAIAEASDVPGKFSAVAFHFSEGGRCKPRVQWPRYISLSHLIVQLRRGSLFIGFLPKILG